jgi:hypothetical protein
MGVIRLFGLVFQFLLKSNWRPLAMADNLPLTMTIKLNDACAIAVINRVDRARHGWKLIHGAKRD